jgi:Zn-dependent alcohol dehydrogenase
LWLNDIAKVLQVIQNSPLIDLLVSHTFPMSRIQEAFELQASGECAKVTLDPWE